jgi:hypothetical protein
MKTGASALFSMSIHDIRPDLDLALLVPNDKDFWNEDIEPIKFPFPADYKANKLLNMAGSELIVANVIGYPKGGANPSVTKGIVSRYAEMNYNRGVNNLALQIDAAINPGNSGGPVFNEQGNLMGIAFSHMEGMQNMSYIIPLILVNRFLLDILRNGKSHRVCGFNFEGVSTENPSLRECLLPPHLRKEKTGTLITRIDIDGSAASGLQKGDILIKIGKHQLNQNGMIEMSGSTISCHHLARLTFPGDQIKIEYVRQGKVHTGNLIMKSIPIPRVPRMEMDASNKYYIFAGMVFQPMNLWHMIDDVSHPNLKMIKLNQYLEIPKENPDDEIIILSNILPSRFNVGYKHALIRLLSVNDIPISNLKQLKDICDTPTEKFIKFELEANAIIILNWKESLLKSPEIAEQYTGKSYTNLK